MNPSTFVFRTRPALLAVAGLVFMALWAVALTIAASLALAQGAAKKAGSPKGKGAKAEAATPVVPAAADPSLASHGLFANTAERPPTVAAVATALPLELRPGDRIALIGNTLWERAQEFGHFEALLHQRFPRHRLVVRNLSWSADTLTLRPRPANFADLDQHLRHEKIDVIFAAFGFNESFAGEAGLPEFRQHLAEFLAGLKTKAYNGRTAPRVVLVSPIANENVRGIPAADLNNARLAAYTRAMGEVARQQGVGFANVLASTEAALRSEGSDLTMNGCHLNERGYEVFARALYEQTFAAAPPELNETLRQAVIDLNRQYFRRYRPLNTYYYTGGRNRDYGYLDFLPAMRNFDQMVANRDERIWKLAQGEPVPEKVDDANVPPLPPVNESRGANEWLSAADELRAFQVDPRFEVNLFAGEEEFPEVAKPIQMRWDTHGRLWISTSKTYPHVYPGHEPDDSLVVLEDTNGDGKADVSTVFARGLHVPLSFEFGDGGVYVSEQPNLTFLKDTDGDGKADVRRTVLSGFGTEDSHHALHDFVRSPDGDLLFRESIFHHSQVETPYGPVRQQNSGWFRFNTRTQRLTSFGSYPSTNPWGVTFDDWGRHVASHPIFAAAFHALDPPYPQQHPAPAGLRAYSGTCGHEFVDWASFPPELQGHMIKVRYKPTNRVEIHKWVEGEFGYDEEYVTDLLFSTNLSFIPVDIGFGPRGDLYICDWYNPVKGHAQYSLRDGRRDRHSGRIWRITAKGRPLVAPPVIAGQPVASLVALLQRPEYRVRYWAKQELREREPAEVERALAGFLQQLNARDERFRHHQLEALWTARSLGLVNVPLLRELLTCDNYHARAAATQQLRYWHAQMPDAAELLRRAANDSSGLVRLEAAIAASYVGNAAALAALLDVFKHPRGGHLQYAAVCALGSHTLRPLWEAQPELGVARLLKQAAVHDAITEPKPTPAELQFDGRPNLKTVRISCEPERMLFSLRQFGVAPGQSVKLVFVNPDATDHNWVLVQPDALAEVGMAANEMARDPRNANSDFHPAEKKHLMLQATPMIGPTRKSRIHVLRFEAPREPGVYPYVCTFPGHWIVMNGEMVVASSPAEAEKLLAAREPKMVREWKLADFPEVPLAHNEQTLVQGMQAFVKARCNQCHVAAGHGVNLGPNLVESIKKYQGQNLLRQILEPSHELNEKFRTYQFVLDDGRVVSGVLLRETPAEVHVAPNLLTPEVVTRLPQGSIERRIAGTVSAMPEGLLNVLTREEILHLLAFVAAGDNLPEVLRHKHPPAHEHP